MKKVVFLTVLTVCIVAHAQAIWECDFGKTGMEGWKVSKNTLVYETVNDRLRVKVIPDAPENYGEFSRVVPFGGENFYLQVRMGNVETSTAEPRARNVATEGAKLGRLLPGWNTFSMSRINQVSFPLSFAQSGNRTQEGAWVDYVSARIIKTPKNGLTVTLESLDGIAKVGDKLIFRYYSADPLATPTLEATCFIVPQFISYRFNEASAVLLKDTGDDNLYEAQVEITSDALTFKSDQKTSLMAMVKVDSVASYFTLPFELDVKTENAVPKDVITAANPQVRQDRQLWFDRTRGDNVAEGKPIRMNPQPNYHLTTNDTDPTDLTDGKLTVHNDDKVWFDKRAVGWYFGNGETYLQIDLGEEEPLNHLVVRCLGGTTGNFKFPKQFDLYVSKDSKTWFNTASMQKLMPCEGAQSDFEKYYYLDESADGYSTRMFFLRGIVAWEFFLSNVLSHFISQFSNCC